MRNLKFISRTLLIVSLLIIGGFFVPTSPVGATTTNITQINFTTSPQTIDINTISAKLTTQTQNASGTSEQVSETNHLTLTSTSATGEFSSSNTNWIPVTTLTMSTNSANRNFYYKDSTPGTYTLSISAQGQTWISAIQTIIINGPPEETATSTPTTDSTPSQNSDTPPRQGGHRHSTGRVLGASIGPEGTNLASPELTAIKTQLANIIIQLIALIREQMAAVIVS